MYFHTQRGLSLTELMIAMGISAIIAGGMYQTFVQQQRLSTQQEQFTEARQNARLSIEVMTEEIREAGFDPGGWTSARRGPSSRSSRYCGSKRHPHPLHTGLELQRHPRQR